MSASAVACPHCGARQSDRDSAPKADPEDPGPLANTKLSKEEVGALLAVESVNAPVAPVGPGLFQVLLLPHPMTSGLGRGLDVVLTLAALPLIVSGAVLMLLFGRRRSFSVFTRRLRGNVELTAALFAVVTGTASVYLLGFLFPLPEGLNPITLAVLGAVALLVRVVIRKLAERA